MLSECYLNEKNLTHGRVMATISKFSPQIFETYFSSVLCIDRLFSQRPNHQRFWKQPRSCVLYNEINLFDCSCKAEHNTILYEVCAMHKGWCSAFGRRVLSALEDIMSAWGCSVHQDDIINAVWDISIVLEHP